MTDLLTVAVVFGSGLAGWHMWLTYKSGGFARRDAEAWTLCPCGHGAALHADFSDGDLNGGCRSGDASAGSRDCHGYCKCPATRAQVIGATAEVQR